MMGVAKNQFVTEDQTFTTKRPLTFRAPLQNECEGSFLEYNLKTGGITIKSPLPDTPLPDNQPVTEAGFPDVLS